MSTIEKDDFTDVGFCLQQLIDFWNVPFFKSGKKDFLEKMEEAGWAVDKIVRLDQKALRMSNWRKPYWVELIMKYPKFFEERY